MRRGHILSGAGLLLAVLSLSGAPAALAASPQDICTDLRDGVVNGSYTSAEWTAYFNDPTIQGYGCGGAIVPPQTPVTPPVTTPPAVSPPAATPPVAAPPAATPAVALTPVAAVAGTQHTTVAPVAKPGVKGANHTVVTPAKASAAAPLATTKTRGTLPFTGSQLSLFALVGLALLAVGLLLRSTGRPNER